MVRYLYRNIVPITYKKIPNNLWTFDLSIRWTVFAPTLAINIVIGINIKKAGIFIKPILKGKFASKKVPEVKKPKAPNRAIINPMAAALPIDLLIG